MSAKRQKMASESGPALASRAGAPQGPPAASTSHPHYQGPPSSNPKFSWEGKLIILTGVNNVEAWIQQTESVARAMNCFSELSHQFASFPVQGTVEAFICESRFRTTWRILYESISGTVWAYMRVLGYAPMGSVAPMPCSAFEYAKLAASRMNIPGSSAQSHEEKVAMIAEALHVPFAAYPTEKHYKKGNKWLRDVLDHYIREGDEQLAEAMYNPIPLWAKKPMPMPPVQTRATDGLEPVRDAESTPALSNDSTVNTDSRLAAPTPPTPHFPDRSLVDPALERQGKRKIEDIDDGITPVDYNLSALAASMAAAKTTTGSA